MATKTSRELALERRKALSDGGKKASGVSASSPNRVRRLMTPVCLGQIRVI